jgi:hypothetical protein
MRRLHLRHELVQRVGSPKTLALIVLGLLLLLLPHPLIALYSPDGAGDDARRRFFDETGFWVYGAFLDFFEEHGGLEIFGYPISAPYNERGLLVQYFQNARMEWHPRSSHSGTVELGKLAEELQLGREAGGASLSFGVDYTSETGHAVRRDFARYFQAYGGAEFFGEPITPMLQGNQKVTQYFQCLQLIWDPATAETRVGNLGEVYVNAHRNLIPPDVLEPLYARRAFREAPGLQVIVGVGYPVAQYKRGQQMTVIVRDDRLGEPVLDARVRLTVQDDLGHAYPALSQELNLDRQGRAQTAVPLDTIRPGSWVVVRVEAIWGTAVATDQDVFLVWW